MNSNLNATTTVTYNWAYPVILVLGVTLAVLVAWIFWRKSKLSNYHFWIIIPIISIVAIYGARWWYLMFNPSDYNSFMDIINPFTSGRSILGAIFFSTIALWIYIRNFGGTDLEFRKAFDIILPSMFIAQAIGRWGNFFNQEVYGTIVSEQSLFWLPNWIKDGMLITSIDPITGIETTAYRQPLFLYESIANIVCWFIIVCIIRNLKILKEGFQGASYLFFYGVIRASMELYRDPEFIMNINGVPTSFILSFFFIAWGLGSMIYYQFYYEKTSWYLSSTFSKTKLIKH